MLMVSPTDKPLAELLHAPLSSIPEKYGVDVLGDSPYGLIGWQRKQFPDDLLASVRDGRLMKELAQMTRLRISVLLIEGYGDYSTDGQLISRYTRWTRQQVRNLYRSIWVQYGIMVEQTDDMQDSATCILEMHSWIRKRVHRSLSTRPKSDERKGPWGTADRRSWGVYFLQGFDGIGASRAEALFDQFGRVPIQWTVTQADLSEVSGIGESTAKRLIKALE